MNSCTASPAPSYPSRNELLVEIHTALRQEDGGGALVYGGRGTGKTTLARRMLTAAGGGPAPVLILPTPALRHVPYGALAPLLVGAAPADLASPLSVLRVVLSYLRKHSAVRGVVVVDDLHLLDGESTALLVQLVGYRALQVIGFAPSPTALPEDVVVLAKDGLLGQWILEPLTDLDVDSVCSTVLGPDVARCVSSRLRTEAGGNPLFLGPILDQAVADESLVAVDGVWVLEDTELSVPVGVTQAVSLMVGQLRDAERTALELTALAGLIDTADLIRLSDEDAVSSLLHDGLLGRVAGRGGAYVENRLVPGHILRTTVPPGRRRTLLRELGTVASDDDTVPARARIRRALWALECGEAVPDDRRLGLAELALWNADPCATLKLVRGMRTPDHIAVAALYRSAALLALDRPDESRAAAPDGTAGPSPRGSFPATDHRFPLERARSSNLAGRYSETIEYLQHFTKAAMDGDGSDARLRVTAHALLAEALGALGRSVEARNHSSAALALVDGRPELMSDLHGTVFLRHAALLVHSGDLAAAAEALSTYTPGREVDYALRSGSIAVLEAAMDIRRGWFRKALATIRPALVSLRRSDHEALLPYALGIGSWAAAALGDAEQVDRWSAEFPSTVSRGAAQYSLLGAALIDAAGILLAPATTTVGLVERALEARACGWYTAEKDILELAVILGDERSPALLAEVAAGLQGVEATVVHAYAQGLARRDARALASTADRADLLHKYLLAANATCRAMELYAGDRDEGSRRGLGPLARRRRERIDGILVLEPTDPRSVPSLTQREHEIALLAVDGLSNRAIARRLVVSTRTVEGHLYRIFAKLDIARREDLATSLDDLLRRA